MTTFDRLLASRDQHGSALWVLLDPDRIDKADLARTTEACVENGAEAILFGGSFLISTNFESMIREVKRVAPEIPLVIFPGDTNQISSAADAILFLSMISGRNPELLIGQHAKAAPTIKAMGLEPIATGYILVESRTQTTVEYVSNTKPLPRAKPDIAMAHALAAEYLGMSCVYLDAGSGAGAMVPVDMVKAVSSYINIPVIAGGGIRTPEDAADRAEAGASFVVVGSVLEENDDPALIRSFAEAIHTTA